MVTRKVQKAEKRIINKLLKHHEDITREKTRANAGLISTRSKREKKNLNEIIASSNTRVADADSDSVNDAEKCSDCIDEKRLSNIQIQKKYSKALLETHTALQGQQAYENSRTSNKLQQAVFQNESEISNQIARILRKESEFQSESARRHSLVSIQKQEREQLELRQSKELEALDIQRKIAVSENMVEKKSVKLKEVGKDMQKLLLNVNSGDSLMDKVPDSM